MTAQITEIEGIKNPQNDLCKNVLCTYPFPIEPWTVIGNRTPHNVVRWTYLRRKYLLERILGGLLLLLAAPLIAVLWTIVRLHSKGGGFYLQTRVGYRGKQFEIIKLRTMIIDAEADGKAKWCVKGDPRITSLGRFLRKTHLDELPQLINVVKGEMTLVGPRPERPCFIVKLKHEIIGYERRLSVLPGITGLAQINLPPDETIEDVRRKQYLDLLYIKQTNLWLDVRMLLATTLRLLGLSGEFVTRALGLHRAIPDSLSAGHPKTSESTTSAPLSESKKRNRLVVSSAMQLATLRSPQSSDNGKIPVHVPNAFTVDVEDYFHVSGFSDRISPRDWDSIPCRVEANTERLLELLNEKKVCGTFFILGWVAERYPKLIQRIADEGHELGCHSYWHRLVYDMTPQEFSEDLSQARIAIEQAAGTEVCLYRAPSFSITKSSLWALDILAEQGFRVDSSIFPIQRDRYGIPESTSAIHVRNGIQQSIVEYPPTAWQVGALRVPIGGGYFRLAPRWLTQMAIDGARRSGIPAMFYVHPWEIDPQQPRVDGVRFMNRFRHSVGLSTTYSKLNWLLDRNRFSTMSEVMNHFHLPNTWSNTLPIPQGSLELSKTG
jgi:polysaccharide deacetylase family protein (PEP-CTERM system associated)